MKRTVGIPARTVALVSLLVVSGGTPAATKAVKIRDICDPALWHWDPAGSRALPDGRALT